MQAEATRGAFSPNERRIVHLTGFGHAATHYVELVYPTLAVGLAAETGLPLTDVLAWSFAGYLLFGLGALPAGLAADRLGARRVILFGLLGSGLSAIAASQVATGWPLALCLAGHGAAASCYHPAGTGLLSGGPLPPDPPGAPCPLSPHSRRGSCPGTCYMSAVAVWP